MTNTYTPNKYKATCTGSACRHKMNVVVNYDYPNFADFKFGQTVKTLCKNCLTYKLGTDTNVVSHETKWGKL